jgi:hypothetical protein
MGRLMRRKPFIAYISALLATGTSILPGCAKRQNSNSMSDMMRSMMGGSMMNVSQSDMQIYMDMFDHHREIRRTVEQLPNGIRAVTESDNPRIAALLHRHVPDMYRHVAIGREVHCTSNSLPTMFRNASGYERHLRLTAKGVVATETSSDPTVLAAIRRHADEVTGFVREGMSAMMRQMMR